MLRKLLCPFFYMKMIACPLAERKLNFPLNTTSLVLVWSLSYYFFNSFCSFCFLKVPSYELMGISQGTASAAESLTLTPFGEACTRMDLTAIHEILEKVGYKDDEGIANEVRGFSFEYLFAVVFQHFSILVDYTTSPSH